MKEFSCGAVVPGCTAVFRANDEDGILTRVARHAREDHELTEIPAELVAQVRSQIRIAA
jgi:predicted small metal-binding protein